MEALKELSHKIDQISRFIIISLFVIAFVATVYQVFSRFVLQSSFVNNSLPMIDFSIFNLTWIEELIRYLFVWIVFLGIGIVYKNNGHAKVEIFYSYLSEKWRIRLSGFVEIVNSSLFIFLMFYGSSILRFTSQQISPSMSLNMSFIYGTVLVFSVICLVHSANNLCEIFVAKSSKIHVTAKEIMKENTNIV
ncbi:TRAP transporter small permease [Bacillus sp. PAMC26568]|nr:TRAP transporter small permease [Bacillus sp. PAMC26568]